MFMSRRTILEKKDVVAYDIVYIYLSILFSRDFFFIVNDENGRNAILRIFTYQYILWKLETRPTKCTRFFNIYVRLFSGNPLVQPQRLIWRLKCRYSKLVLALSARAGAIGDIYDSKTRLPVPQIPCREAQEISFHSGRRKRVSWVFEIKLKLTGNNDSKHHDR